LGFLKERKKSN